MANGPLNQDTKKLLNNSGLRARLAAASCLCDAAEDAAGSLTRAELESLDAADQPLVSALSRFQRAYEDAFRRAGARLLKQID